MSKSRKGPHPLASRIKKMMQTDEDVGKISQATPVLMSKALELFIQRLVDSTVSVARQRGAKTLTAPHLKAVVDHDPLLDFLKDTLEGVPDLGAEDEVPQPKIKRQRINKDALPFNGGNSGGHDVGSAAGQNEDDATVPSPEPPALQQQHSLTRSLTQQAGAAAASSWAQMKAQQKLLGGLRTVGAKLADKGPSGTALPGTPAAGACTPDGPKWLSSVDREEGSRVQTGAPECSVKAETFEQAVLKGECRPAEENGGTEQAHSTKVTGQHMLGSQAIEAGQQQSAKFTLRPNSLLGSMKGKRGLTAGQVAPQSQGHVVQPGVAATAVAGAHTANSPTRQCAPTAPIKPLAPLDALQPDRPAADSSAATETRHGAKGGHHLVYSAAEANRQPVTPMHDNSLVNRAWEGAAAAAIAASQRQERSIGAAALSDVLMKVFKDGDSLQPGPPAPSTTAEQGPLNADPVQPSTATPGVGQVVQQSPYMQRQPPQAAKPSETAADPSAQPASAEQRAVVAPASASDLGADAAVPAQSSYMHILAQLRSAFAPAGAPGFGAPPPQGPPQGPNLGPAQGPPPGLLSPQQSMLQMLAQFEGGAAGAASLPAATPAGGLEQVLRMLQQQQQGPAVLATPPSASQMLITTLMQQLSNAPAHMQAQLLRTLVDQHQQEQQQQQQANTAAMLQQAVSLVHLTQGQVQLPNALQLVQQQQRQQQQQMQQADKQRMAALQALLQASAGAPGGPRPQAVSKLPDTLHHALGAFQQQVQKPPQQQAPELSQQLALEQVVQRLWGQDVTNGGAAGSHGMAAMLMELVRQGADSQQGLQMLETLRRMPAAANLAPPSASVAVSVPPAVSPRHGTDPLAGLLQTLRARQQNVLPPSCVPMDVHTPLPSFPPAVAASGPPVVVQSAVAPPLDLASVGALAPLLTMLKSGVPMPQNVVDVLGQLGAPPQLLQQLLQQRSPGHSGASAGCSAGKLPGAYVHPTHRGALQASPMQSPAPGASYRSGAREGSLLRGGPLTSAEHTEEIGETPDTAKRRKREATPSTFGVRLFPSGEARDSLDRGTRPVQALCTPGSAAGASGRTPPERQGSAQRQGLTGERGIASGTADPTPTPGPSPEHNKAQESGVSPFCTFDAARMPDLSPTSRGTAINPPSSSLLPSSHTDTAKDTVAPHAWSGQLHKLHTTVAPEDDDYDAED